LLVLAVVLIFGAYLNAFAMIRPVYALQEGLARLLQTSSRAPGLVVLFLFGLVVLPAILLTAASLISRTQTPAASLAAIARRYVWTLAPMGFAMWLAHYAFHFLTGALTIVPVVQSFLADVGWYGGTVRWDLGSLVPQAWLFPIEAALLYLGAMASIVVAVQVASSHLAELRKRTGKRSASATPPSAALLAAAPWIVITMLMLGFGIWIMLQPMEMRGTMFMVPGG
jgi:hypothetical protein